MALRPSRNHRHQDHLRLSALHRQRRAIALAPWTPFLNRGELLEACLIDPEVVHQVHQARTDSRTEKIHGHPSNRIGGNRKTIGGSLNQIMDSLRVLPLPRHHAGVKIRTNRARPMITDTATGIGNASELCSKNSGEESLSTFWGDSRDSNSQSTNSSVAVTTGPLTAACSVE